MRPAPVPPLPTGSVPEAVDTVNPFLTRKLFGVAIWFPIPQILFYLYIYDVKLNCHFTLN
jgi:hypothetical protein